jgi:hypothetical protein
VSPDHRLESFAVLLWFDRISPEDARHDPGVFVVHRWLQSIDAADQHCWYTRFWMDEGTYQGPSPANTTSFSLSVPEMLAQKPRVMAMCCRDPQQMLAGVPVGFYKRVPDGEFEVDGRRYGIIYMDFREISPVAWYRQLIRALAGAPPPGAGGPAPLDRQAFYVAVRRALRVLYQDDLLAKNPLVSCRLVQALGPHATSLHAAQALQRILRDQSQMLGASPKDADAAQVLAATYLQPGVKQLAVADRLGMPYGTYRHILERAIRRLTDVLWQRELAGREALPDTWRPGA